jgi:negative regulator of flagellin synthesis FlgM
MKVHSQAVDAYYKASTQQAVGTRAAAAKSQSTEKARETSAGDAATVSISAEGRAKAASDVKAADDKINTQKVEALRQQIAEGSYQVNSGAIASKMVSELA